MPSLHPVSSYRVKDKTQMQCPIWSLENFHTGGNCSSSFYSRGNWGRTGQVTCPRLLACKYRAVSQSEGWGGSLQRLAARWLYSAPPYLTQTQGLRVGKACEGRLHPVPKTSVETVLIPICVYNLYHHIVLLSTYVKLFGYILLTYLMGPWTRISKIDTFCEHRHVKIEERVL